MRALFFCILFFGLSFIILAVPKDNSGELPKEATWVKSETGVWFGDYNLWYKIDKSSTEARITNSIKISHNKKKWQSADNVSWHDKQGRWYYIDNNRLLYTNDNKHWLEVPNKTWQGPDDKWYKLDANWDLWEVKM